MRCDLRHTSRCDPPTSTTPVGLPPRPGHRDVGRAHQHPGGALETCAVRVRGTPSTRGGGRPPRPARRRGPRARGRAEPRAADEHAAGHPAVVSTSTGCRGPGHDRRSSATTARSSASGGDGPSARGRTHEMSPVRPAVRPGRRAGRRTRRCRRRGTVVGSVAFADPSAELPAALLALDGRRSDGPDGERTVAADDLFTGAFRTCSRRGELVTAVRVPRGATGRPARLDRGLPPPGRPAGMRGGRRRRLGDGGRSPRRASRCAASAHARSGSPPSRRRSSAPSPRRMRSPPPRRPRRARTSTRRATPTVRPTTAVTSPSS